MLMLFVAVHPTRLCVVGERMSQLIGLTCFCSHSRFRIPVLKPNQKQGAQLLSG